MVFSTRSRASGSIKRTTQPPPPAPQTLPAAAAARSEEHTSELQSHHDLVCRLLLEKKKQSKRRRRNDRNVMKKQLSRLNMVFMPKNTIVIQVNIPKHDRTLTAVTRPLRRTPCSVYH